MKYNLASVSCEGSLIFPQLIIIGVPAIIITSSLKSTTCLKCHLDPLLLLTDCCRSAGRSSFQSTTRAVRTDRRRSANHGVGKEQLPPNIAAAAATDTDRPAKEEESGGGTRPQRRSLSGTGWSRKGECLWKVGCRNKDSRLRSSLKPRKG